MPVVEEKVVELALGLDRLPTETIVLVGVVALVELVATVVVVTSGVIDVVAESVFEEALRDVLLEVLNTIVVVSDKDRLVDAGVVEARVLLS